MSLFTEFYCQTTGSNLNAGSTTADAASLTYASGNWVQGTRVFTVASGDPAADGVLVGDFVSVYADGSTVTGFVGRVTARDATTITISGTAIAGTSPTDGTGDRTLKVGGAWKGPNGAEIFPVNFATGTMLNTSSYQPRINFKSGVQYDITASLAHNINSAFVQFEGYTSSPGDGGRAVIDGGATGASYILLDIQVSGDRSLWKNFEFKNNGDSGSAAGINIASGATFICIEGVVVHDVRGWGFLTNVSGFSVCEECEAYNCNQSNTAGMGGIRWNDGNIRRCISHNNNRIGISYGGTGGPIQVSECIAAENTEHGFINGSHRGYVCLDRCVAYDNGDDGIGVGGSGAQSVVVVIQNCILYDNSGYGIDMDGSAGSTCVYYLRNNAFYNNSSGEVKNPTGASGVGFAVDEDGRITLSGDPFVSAATGDFRVSSSDVKGTGIGSFLQTQAGYTGTIGYPDIGAAQHQDSSTGSNVVKIINFRQ